VVVSSTGRSADLTKGTQFQSYLAFKRAAVEERSFRFSMPPILLDLCLCMDNLGNSCPMEYNLIGRKLDKLGVSGEEVYLG
jgi:hypothetical protein